MAAGKPDVGIMHLVFFSGCNVTSASDAPRALAFFVIFVFDCGRRGSDIIFVSPYIIEGIKNAGKNRRNDNLPYGEPQVFFRKAENESVFAREQSGNQGMRL